VHPRQGSEFPGTGRHGARRCCDFEEIKPHRVAVFVGNLLPKLAASTTTAS
jgi:hypothetical protein